MAPPPVTQVSCHPLRAEPGSLKEKLLKMVTVGLSCDGSRGESEARGGRWRREGIAGPVGTGDGAHKGLEV